MNRNGNGLNDVRNKCDFFFALFDGIWYFGFDFEISRRMQARINSRQSFRAHINKF